ncbi:uncharacterized protein N7496_006189 [Penicillium cataractarum]|uniref:Cyclochlorotine biosynthesis protein O n=1 Tax=Penicillium cataractarum TaxID=2100454 RepID=A0A9W9S1T3_9EURO|nr:uncharacterized protein N7496_006189 [Penicillium cataractarum]KAJ5370097.1 hypothetical protein N7496_006189 [Penicillium cataractarum]
MSEESRPFISHGSRSLAEKSDDESSENFVIEIRQPKSLLFLRIACVLEGIALILLTIGLILAFQTRNPELDSDLECARQVSAYSPLLEEPDLIKYSEYDLPLYFNEKTDYRGPPTPEREVMWEKLWHQGAFEVPEDKLGIMNKSHSGRTYKHVPPEVGTGYAAQLEVLHQLHCVHMLRQWSYKEHWLDKGLDLPGSLYGDPKLTRMHLDHCIEVLRANIMCTSDVTPILIELDPKAPFGERADFRSNHKCRNFWEIRQWVIDHTAIP